jgi:NAD(P)-dependent dehydrogenase (short-subunit alcohol dehydrogenase family)
VTKNAYVTGADRGLGFALVEELLKRGWQVFAGSYLKERKELDHLVSEYPGSLYVISLDISDISSVNAAAAVISSQTNKLNLIINNAGIASMHDKDSTIFEEIDYEELIHHFDVNALGMLRVTKSVLNLLLNADDKRLVNITSLAGSVKLLTRTTQIGYTMSKAAGNMQTKLLYNSLNPKGVKVFAIHPGWMHTKLFGDADLMKAAPFKPHEAAVLILDFTLNAEQDTDPESPLADHVFFGNDGKPMDY